MSPTTDSPPPKPGAGSASRWWTVGWRALLATVWLGGSLAIWMTRKDELLAGHPAYAVMVTAVGITGGALAVGAARFGFSPRPRSRSRWLIGLGRTAAVVATIAVVGGLLWLRPLPASAGAAELVASGAKSGGNGKAVVIDDTATRITLRSGAPRVGLVFQPGARVDPRAYIPLLSRVAARGYLVVVIKQPLNIALLVPGAPGSVIADHREIERWVVGGHSLGGVAAASYAGEHPGVTSGLLLWASYPAHSLAAGDTLAVTSVWGTKDGFTTRDDIKASRADLPAKTAFVRVKGAVHGFFGDYGEQPGDGTPTISRREAQRSTCSAGSSWARPSIWALGPGPARRPPSAVRPPLRFAGSRPPRRRGGRRRRPPS